MAKKLNINFDTKSLQRAMQEIRKIQWKLIKQIPNAFIERCLKWVKTRANSYLSYTPMSVEVTQDIKDSWHIEIKNNVGKLTNDSNKAVFVEFGVGMVGQSHPHPKASEENYEYNVKTNYKHSDGKWVFNAEDKENGIDLNQGYFYIYQRENSGKVVALTKGSPSNMYLYNAMMDLLTTGIYKIIWKEVLDKEL